VIGSALPCTDQLIALLSPRRQQREPIATPEAYPLDIDQRATPRLIVARLGLFISRVGSNRQVMKAGSSIQALPGLSYFHGARMNLLHRRAFEPGPGPHASRGA
jgi:hypothetical protein